jgi:hypothetical protein
VKGTWKAGPLAGEPEGYVEKALETGISFYRGPAGEHGRGLIYQELREVDEEGSRNEASPSEEGQCRGPMGRAPLLGTLEDMLR